MISKAKPLIQKFAGAIACSIAANGTRSEVNARKIAYHLYHAQGAHKPSQYDFGDEEVKCNSLSTKDDDSSDAGSESDFA